MNTPFSEPLNTQFPEPLNPSLSPRFSLTLNSSQNPFGEKFGEKFAETLERGLGFQRSSEFRDRRGSEVEKFGGSGSQGLPDPF